MSLIGARRSFLSQGGQLPFSEIGQLLRLVGYEATDEEVSQLIVQAGGEDMKLKFGDFKRLEHAHRKKVRKVMEDNGGVSTVELMKYTKKFHAYDASETGFLTQKAMRELLGVLFPNTATCKERSKRLGQMVKDADADQNGKFDFEE